MDTSLRKQEIVEVAISLISERGMTDLTMKRIASAIGVSEPALYRHFSSKVEILSGVVDEMVRARSASFAEARANGRDPVHILLAFFEAHAGLFMRRPAMTAILFSEDLFKNNDSLSARVAALMAETQRDIRGVIEEGKTNGLFRPDLDGETASLLLVGGFRLLVVAWRMEGAAFDLAVRTETFIRATLELFQAGGKGLKGKGDSV